MNEKKLLLFLLENNASDVVSGDVVLIIKKIFLDLYHIDDVRERNNVGMNQTDKTNSRNYIIPFLGDDDDRSIRIPILYRIMRILGNYRKTQVPTYTILETMVKELLKGRIQDVVSDDRKIVLNYTKTSYGKILVTYPDDITPRSNLSKQIKEAQDLYFSKMNIPKESDNYGNYDYPRFKYFSKNKNSIGNKEFYVKVDLAEWINTKVFPSIPVEEIGNNTKSNDTIEIEKKSTDEKIKFITTVTTPYGKKHQIELPKSKSYAVYSDIKANGLTPKLMSFDFNSKNHYISAIPSEYAKLKQYFDRHQLDTSELDGLYVDVEETPKQISSEKGLIFTNMDRDKLGLSYIRNQSSDSKAFLKQLIQYIFYDYTWNSTLYRYEVTGDFKQYAMFKNIMERFEYNVGELDKIIKEKVSKGFLDNRESMEGELDPKMESIVNNKLDVIYPNSKFQLYDLQKEGVKFLASRKYAILGSETGAGKTIQFIYAADLVTRETDDNILIVTLKSVQKQLIQEIIDIFGEDVRNQISIDGLNPKKWTVLTYPNFSSGKDVDSRVFKLINSRFKVIILDELHKVKHDTTKTSVNLERVSRNIPIKWGATATLSSNKPINVRNQLKMLDHPLGNIPLGKFKKEFCGMVLKDIMRKSSNKPIYSDDDFVDDEPSYGGRTKAYVDGTIEQQLEAAENLHRWLSLTGVYIRHSKKDMKKAKGEEMPDANISTQVNNINPDTLRKMVASKLTTYKDEDLEISKLIAFRESISRLKVPHTVRETINLITENQQNSAHDYAKSKVLIFTNFTESGRLLQSILSEELQKINPKWKVYTYLSSTPKNEILSVKKNMESRDSKVLIMSMKMGGTGISFPNTFGNMIINDYDWTPEAIEQSEGRIYRINTVQDVNIKYMLGGEKDQELFEKVQLKKKISEIIQTYRENYLESENGAEWISKIVNLQKQMIDIDEDIKRSSATQISSALSESFKQFFSNYTSLICD